MEIITPEQYQKYIKALNYNCAEMDIRYLIFKYEFALIDYYHNRNADIDDLELIVDAFLYFSQLEVSSNLDEYAQLLVHLLNEKKDASKYTTVETLAVYSYMIADRFVRKEISDLLMQKGCAVLYKMSSTIIPIKKYTEQYGDIHDHLNELKENLNKLEEHGDSKVYKIEKNG